VTRTSRLPLAGTVITYLRRSALSCTPGTSSLVTRKSRDRITSGEFETYARYQVFKDGELVRETKAQYAVTYWRTTMRYTLTNAKPEPVEVELIQSGLDQGWWSRDFRVTSEDVPGVQLNADRRKYVITVPANGKREVRVTYATRY